MAAVLFASSSELFVSSIFPLPLENIESVRLKIVSWGIFPPPHMVYIKICIIPDLLNVPENEFHVVFYCSSYCVLHNVNCSTKKDIDFVIKDDVRMKLQISLGEKKTRLNF